MSQMIRMRELLEKETFPHDFLFKFVGKNSSEFTGAVDTLVETFPGLRVQSKRMSQGERHMALGYTLSATTPEEIISVYEKIALIPDLVFIL